MITSLKAKKKKKYYEASFPIDLMLKVEIEKKKTKSMRSG
jgi:hypothetical protein